MYLPFELVNHVLSFRPTHPAAKLIKELYESKIRQLDEELYEYIEYGGTFMEISTLDPLNSLDIFKNIISGDIISGDEGYLWKPEIVKDYEFMFYEYGIQM